LRSGPGLIQVTVPAHSSASAFVSPWPAVQRFVMIGTPAARVCEEMTPPEFGTPDQIAGIWRGRRGPATAIAGLVGTMSPYPEADLRSAPLTLSESDEENMKSLLALNGVVHPEVDRELRSRACTVRSVAVSAVWSSKSAAVSSGRAEKVCSRTVTVISLPC
jgi:hypothetical protein